MLYKQLNFFLPCIGKYCMHATMQRLIFESPTTTKKPDGISKNNVKKKKSPPPKPPPYHTVRSSTRLNDDDQNPLTVSWPSGVFDRSPPAHRRLEPALSSNHASKDKAHHISQRKAISSSFLENRPQNTTSEEKRSETRTTPIIEKLPELPRKRSCGLSALVSTRETTITAPTNPPQPFDRDAVISHHSRSASCPTSPTSQRIPMPRLKLSQEDNYFLDQFSTTVNQQESISLSRSSSQGSDAHPPPVKLVLKSKSSYGPRPLPPKPYLGKLISPERNKLTPPGLEHVVHNKDWYVEPYAVVDFDEKQNDDYEYVAMNPSNDKNQEPYLNLPSSVSSSYTPLDVSSMNVYTGLKKGMKTNVTPKPNSWIANNNNATSSGKEVTSIPLVKC